MESRAGRPVGGLRGGRITWRVIDRTSHPRQGGAIGFRAGALRLGTRPRRRTLAEDGRIRSVLGFLDGVPAAPTA